MLTSFSPLLILLFSFFFFFNDTATTEIYTLSLHDALPISGLRSRPDRSRALGLQSSGVQRCARRLHFPCEPSRLAEIQRRDRKSTRLNSSHPSISYAVFCLKKKKKKTYNTMKQYI